jgi:hypothetical protein
MAPYTVWRQVPSRRGRLNTTGTVDSEGVQSLDANEYPVSFSPDGLTEQVIDALLREVDGAAAVRPRPSSVLMDGTAAQRRYRREARRSVAAVARALLPQGSAGGLGGWAA